MISCYNAVAPPRAQAFLHSISHTHACSHALILSFYPAPTRSCFHALMISYPRLPSCSHGIALERAHAMVLSYPRLLSCSHSIALPRAHAFMLSSYHTHAWPRGGPWMARLYVAIRLSCSHAKLPFAFRSRAAPDLARHSLEARRI